MGNYEVITQTKTEKERVDLSIIIPTYKPQEYIWECLNSLNKQTIDKKHFEIILVLNGCKEPYESQIRNYIKTLGLLNIVFIQTDAPGVSNARNIGLDIAQGDYICFIDDDDVISSNYLEELSNTSSNENMNSIIISNVVSFINNDVNCTKDDYLSFNEQVRTTNLVKYRRFLSSACCKLIPVNIIRDKRFNTKFKNGEDALFMFSISEEISSLILSSPTCIYYRRIREDSASRKKQSICYEIKNRLKLQITYTTIYLKNPFKFNLIFYLTRMAAIWKSFKIR